MKVVVILNLIVVLIALISIISVTWKFIKENKVHRKHMRNLDDWSNFHKQLMEWAKEIQDPNVRVDFINHCVHDLIKTGNDKMNNNKLDEWSIDLEKMKICNEWGQYIPSLVQEIRESRLNQILRYECE